jgi:hemerythrin
MPAIEWHKGLETGLWPVDAQHQQLVGLINSLEKAVRAEATAAVMRDILSELVSYTKEHFRVEERMMEIALYPGIGKHKLFHAYFVKRLESFQSRFSAGDESVASDLLDFLKLWFVDHVTQTDCDYIPYLAKTQT